MEVAVKDCEVILTGTVETRDEKKLAFEIAESVSGVTNVENRLHVTVRGI
jgi:osmotically-inducible protein OsmY